MIVADNGATKSEWYITDGAETHHVLLPGYNPATGTEQARADFLHEVSKNIKTQLKTGTLFFYSAGVGNSMVKAKIQALLKELFPNMEIVLETDLTGAGRAIFEYKEGITAILGTGSNAGYYNGYSIIHQPESLGFFLGDEGSGAYLGKQMLKAYLEETLPEDIADHLFITFQKYPDGWIQKLLKQPAAFDYGRLAAEMLAFRTHPFVIETATNAFNDFFRHIVSRVKHPGQRRIGFAGKVAFTFSDILEQATLRHGYQLYNIISSPASALLQYHKNV
jgi:N-acetylglucosamine kinase-like BadF-type ATPase